MDTHFIFWVIFAVVVSAMFYVDLYATEHRQGTVGIKTSLMWSGIWIGAALLFNLAIYLFMEGGHSKSLEFLAGYIIEKSLSVDNLFVFIMIFKVMGIEEKNQPHVLKWGILSAIVMRIVFILAGVALISLFHPVIYIFGILLFYAAYKMAFGGEEKINLEHNPLFRFASRKFNLVSNYNGKKFFVKQQGKTYITPLFLTFLLIESADLIFAVDSIPAVIAITKDIFVIITSNIFAVLGLRALYFALAGIVKLFTYLKYGVAVILFYVGVKMILSDIHPIPTEISLLLIVFFLAASIILSLVFPKKEEPER
ncbi:MAG TPA: TerC/Alx family metal homeostasis membrane protein [Ignavibacteriales bacterium]|nr:TerC/Alx family metal homeostasis membrane protein [Ignavibacteriales bacterium]